MTPVETISLVAVGSAMLSLFVAVAAYAYATGLEERIKKIENGEKARGNGPGCSGENSAGDACA